ncbi:MAG: ATPase [Bacteroidetes bacterium 4572_112]|nr:MAG: ATPase [Bacteroidetes bacterium 4572_112]
MIKRSIKQSIVNSLKLKEVTIIIGARQIGKTTVLKEIIVDLKFSGKKVVYFNLDIEDDSKHFATQQQLLNKINLEVGANEAYIFIDEIQQKENAGKFLKGIYDMDLPYKFVVTGSGSLELKEKISEALTGRKHFIEMKAVSFLEFVNFKTYYKYENRINKFFEIEPQKTTLLLNEYLAFGGYPAVVTEDTVERKLEIMNEIFISYITKDISFLLGVRYPDKFVKMIKLLAVQVGGILNYSQLAQDIGIRVETLKTFLWYAEQTYIISIIKPYYTNQKKEITKSPTVYFNDIGMLNFSRNSFSINNIDGMIFQNFIFTIIDEKYKQGLSEINFWRSKDKAEVDFVVHTQDGVLPIEVKYKDMKKSAITRSFRSFVSNYKPNMGVFVNLGYRNSLNIADTTVDFIPYWELYNI